MADDLTSTVQTMNEETIQELVQPEDKPKKTVHDWIRDLRMSPDVNRTTVGVETDRVTPELMLATSRKLLAINRREADSDPKDSLQFQRVYGPADFFAEHVLKDAGSLGRQLLWKATNRGTVDFMPVGALEQHVSDVFNGSKLTNMVDGSSPLETIEASYKISRIGEGGIGDIDSAPAEMRLVQPSFLGYVDPVRSVECLTSQHLVKTRDGWKPISDVTLQDSVLCLVDGKPEYHNPTDIHTADFTGPVYSFKSLNREERFDVTATHRVPIFTQTGSYVDCIHAEDLYSITPCSESALDDHCVCGSRLYIGCLDSSEHLCTDMISRVAATEYSGKIYCLTVPGGIFYAKHTSCGLGYWTGNSLKVGLDAYMTKHVKRGSDGKLYQMFINARTGRPELVDSVTAAKSVVATPEMRDANTDFISAVGGTTGVRIVRKSDVDYYLPAMDDAFTNAANLVTALSGVKELRLLMGCLHPATCMVTCNKARMVDIVYAKDIASSDTVLPGMMKDGTESAFAVKGTYTKFPRNRAWFKKVVLYSGRTMITSRDHKWTVLRDTGITQVPADALKQGDVILRTTFSTLPTRRTFINSILVNDDIAVLLGITARSLTETDSGNYVIEVVPRHSETAKRALNKLQLNEFTQLNTSSSYHKLTVKPCWFHQWLEENIGIKQNYRHIPSVILSTSTKLAALFIDGYSSDETKVAMDEMDYAWLLDIPNPRMRDGLAFLLERTGVDCYYRDAYLGNGQYQLALKIVEAEKGFGDCIKDAVKAVMPVQNAPVMIDIDIDDNMYAVANGIVTHNSKYPQQAVSITGREAPYVRNIDSKSGKDFHSTIGRYLGARYAKKPGTVSAVRNDRIDMLYDDGTKGSIALYRNFPMNAKGYLDNTPQVKAGEHVNSGDLVASSNYTDDKGVSAIGSNMRTAWLSWHGGTYEDAIVISESAAKKLASSTMYSTDLDLDKTISLGKKNYVTWKPGEFTKEQLTVLDDEGVVKPGMIVHKGDPLVLAVQTAEPSPGTLGKRVLTDVSETWEHQHPGIITDVVKTKTGVKVLAKVTAPVEVGDKLSGGYGNKGIVSQILPDDKMPQDKDGNPVEVLLSPLGLITRCNPAQLVETLLGKVAHKTGKTEVIPAFYNGNLHKYVMDKLKQHRLEADDDFIDPDTGKSIPNVVNGYSYIYRLKHMAEGKESARGTGEYSSDETPGGAGFESSKRFGPLEQSAMAAHGAFANLLDNKLIRGQSNADFWRSVRTGGLPTIPGEPLVQRKFFAHLQGAGVNVRKTPEGISVFALSNADVNELAGPRELKSSSTYEARTFRPIDGGLFGQDVFGLNGDKWGYIQLDEPVPNPVMAGPLAKLLHMSDKDFIAVAAGVREVDNMANGAQIKQRLASIDLKQESAKALKEFKDAPASKKDAALKRYVAIERMNRAGVNASEYMLDRIPVLPPVYRPVSSHGGLTMVADANYLYKQLLDARDDVREAQDLPKEYQDKARLNLYNKWQELTGMYDPEDIKLRNKNVGGLLQWALGKGSPKGSAFQRKVLGNSVDTVGRGVVLPDARINVDQVGIPVSMAFGIMAPFVERALVNRGYTPINAMKMVKQESPQALDILKQVMETHPVQLNRAPTLHKYSIMGLKPILVQGNAIHTNPSICPGLAMDYDGDTVNIHVPVSDNARRETLERMLPSKNFIALSDHKIMNRPEKEYVQGLYIATRLGQAPNGRATIFRTLDEAKQAYQQGIIKADTPIQILENKRQSK